MEYIRRELEEEGHSVAVCHDGASGLRAAELESFDIIILDIMMPFMDGLEVTRRLRRQNIQTPLLLLTARDAPEEIVRGLDAGADDYLTKPFSFDVLLARIRVRTRAATARDERLRFADLTLDPAKREAWRGKRQIALTRTEFAILECLMRAAGRVVPRDSLIDQDALGEDAAGSSADLDALFHAQRIANRGRNLGVVAGEPTCRGADDAVEEDVLCHGIHGHAEGRGRLRVVIG